MVVNEDSAMESMVVSSVTCDKDQDMGCFNLGALKYKEGRQKAAIKYFKKACDLGHPTACHNLKKLEN